MTTVKVEALRSMTLSSTNGGRSAAHILLHQPAVMDLADILDETVAPSRP